LLFTAILERNEVIQPYNFHVAKNGYEVNIITNVNIRTDESVETVHLMMIIFVCSLIASLPQISKRNRHKSARLCTVAAHDISGLCPPTPRIFWIFNQKISEKGKGHDIPTTHNL
jgi:hypothetical protein